MIDLIYHASYSKLALPSTHRFPITKYEHLYRFLLEQQHALPTQFIAPSSASIAEVSQIHCPKYVEQFFTNQLSLSTMRRIGFPWSANLLERTRFSLNGTLLTAQRALQHGIAIHLSGGYHHAHYDFGSGYCIFNDLVYAAHRVIKHSFAEKVLIFDCDVHQGDGTAVLANKQSQIITCSIHCEKNFPTRKRQSDFDIGLKVGIQDAEYLATVEQTLNLLIRIHQPDLIIYDAGVDVHIEDRLGHLELSNQGIFCRDHLVLNTAKRAGVPIAAVIGGGYDINQLALTTRHSQLFIAANDIYTD